MKQVLGSNLVYYRNFSVYMIYMLQLSIFGHILGKNEHFNFLLLLDLHSDLSDSGFYILRLTMGGIIRFPGVWIYPCNNHHCSNHSILSYCGDWIGRMIWWPYRTWYRLHNMLNACFTREWGSPPVLWMIDHLDQRYLWYFLIDQNQIR